MKITKIAFLAAAAALLFSGCGPSHRPGDWDGRSAPTGSDAGTANVVEEFADPNDTLTMDDGRDESDTSTKVSDWVNNDSIPENAKLAVIYFGFDKFNVEAPQRAKLDAIIDAVNNGNIYIVGYSDYFGTEEYNLALSDKRAQAVKNYLKQLGADDSAVIQAVGEAYAVQNGTKSEVAEDRKVIVIDGNAQ